MKFLTTIIFVLFSCLALAQTWTLTCEGESLTLYDATTEEVVRIAKPFSIDRYSGDVVYMSDAKGKSHLLHVNKTSFVTIDSLKTFIYDCALSGTTNNFSVFAIARGLVNNITRTHKTAWNDDIDIGTPEDMWTGGGSYTFLTSADRIVARGVSANDTLSGTGAHYVVVEGVDSNYAAISDTLTMDNSPVDTSELYFFRVNRVYVDSVGSNGVNHDTIRIQTVGDSTLVAQVQPGMGEALQLQYTAPAGYTAWARDFSVSGSVWGMAKAMVKSPGVSWKAKRIFILNNEPPSRSTMIQIPEKTDFNFTVDSVSANNTGVAVGCNFVVIKN